MKKLITKFTTVGLLLSVFNTFSSVNAQEMRGERTGNGGDGVIINGEAILRDLMPNGELQLNNREFIEEIPGLIEMLKNLYQANSRLALSIYDDLTSEDIWFLPGSLPRLPDQYVPYLDQRSRITFAVRRPFEGDGSGDILISRRAYRQLKEDEKKCLLLHESLHSHRNLSVTPDNAQTHHLYVRQLTRFICESNGNVDSQELNSLMVRLNFSNDKNIAEMTRRLSVIAPEDYHRLGAEEFHRRLQTLRANFSETIAQGVKLYPNVEQICGLMINDNNHYNWQIEMTLQLFGLTQEQCVPHIQDSIARTVDYLRTQFPNHAVYSRILRSVQDRENVSNVSALPNFFSSLDANEEFGTDCGRLLINRGGYSEGRFNDCFKLNLPSRLDSFSERSYRRRVRRFSNRFIENIAAKWNAQGNIQQICQGQYLSGQAQRNLDAFLTQSLDEKQRLETFLSTDSYESTLAKVYIRPNSGLSEFIQAQQYKFDKRKKYCENIHQIVTRLTIPVEEEHTR